MIVKAHNFTLVIVKSLIVWAKRNFVVGSIENYKLCGLYIGHTAKRQILSIIFIISSTPPKNRGRGHQGLSASKAVCCSPVIIILEAKNEMYDMTLFL